MKKFIKKVGYLLPLYFAIAGGSIIVIMLFRWLLEVSGNTTVKEEILHFFIPLLVPLIPTIIWLRPRMKVLNESKQKDILMFVGYTVFVIIGVISSLYYESISNKLTTVRDPDGLSDISTRFVQVRRMEIDTSERAIYTDIRLGGKYSQELQFTSYVAFPLITQDTNSRFRFWYGETFHDRIRNSAGTAVKEKSYSRHIESVRTGSPRKDLRTIRYYDILTPSSGRDDFIKAIAKSRAKHTDEVMILEAKDGEYDRWDRGKIRGFLWTLGIGSVLILILLSFTGLNEKKYRAQKKKKPPLFDQEEREHLKFLIPGKALKITPTLLLLNIAVFIAMALSGINPMHASGPELLSWGALRSTEFAQGEWWRLFTSMFIHEGFAHLTFNCIILFVTGFFLEPQSGHIKFAFIYIISGVIAGIATLYWDGSGILIGASGAIYGIIGALLANMIHLKMTKSERTVLYVALGYVGFNILIGEAMGHGTTAHIGGLVSGIVLVYIMRLYTYLKKMWA